MWQKTKNIYHLLVAVLANMYFRFPSRKLVVIGVTGTDGKTTTASLIYHLLKSSGRQASLISTVGAYIGDKTYDVGFHVTNPASVPLQKFIQQINHLGKSEKNYLVLEVTSHGIDQNRVWGIPFDVGVITNVTHEHLDYHKTYDNYLKTKARLLKKANVAIINKDDASFNPLVKILGSKPYYTYGIISDADMSPQKFLYTSVMEGGYQQYNELAAISVCKQLGITDDDIRKGLQSFVLPKGRLELVYDEEFKVIIDFAHTPNAFEQLLPQLKKQTNGKLIHVFGSAGKRDNTKRPKMGKISSEYADVSIITAEDPRSERIETISAQIESGMDENHERYTIPDRKEAIEDAIHLAKKGDIVVLTGKAHEKSMNYGHGEEPWDEFAVVKEALKGK